MSWFKTAGSTIGGACVGAGASAVIGRIGIVAMGTGIGVGMGPFIAIGAGLGATGYGVYKLGQHHERNRQEYIKKGKGKK
ncbi:MAG TPA: hypothetical protein VKN82_02225 [Desulfohalobiaceae bacterium]|nr:hypothetical protein [Desulfohalobiaceae bacterium]